MPNPIEDLASAYLNVLQMMVDRGYDIGEFKKVLSDLPRNRPLVVAWIKADYINVRNSLRMVFERSDRERTYIQFAAATGSKVSREELQAFFQKFNENKCMVGIFISILPLSPPAVECLKIAEGNPNYHFQTILEKDLLNNPTLHDLVPRCRILSAEEKKNLEKKKKGILFHQMPRIYTDDAIARWYGLKPGQVMEERYEELFENVLAPETITYRLAHARVQIKK